MNTLKRFHTQLEHVVARLHCTYIIMMLLVFTGMSVLLFPNRTGMAYSVASVLFLSPHVMAIVFIFSGILIGSFATRLSFLIGATMVLLYGLVGLVAVLTQNLSLTNPVTVILFWLLLVKIDSHHEQ